MDKQQVNEMEPAEVKQARQRASVKWLLSKAFNNRVPENLKEPFYRDHENQEHLKPQIVVGLGNATLYCQTLANLYSDPNYQSLNHWSILQTLARKGVPVVESPDMPLTETVLIQTNPLRINAHMSVIESLMILYAKEISSGDRIPNAIRRISGSSPPTPLGNCEAALLSWISHACAALKKRIDQEIENGATDENGVRFNSPDIPPIRDFQDLCDGVCLALLISYYCPKVIPWTSVRINYLPAVEDSIHNVLLVSNFSQKYLPYSVFHMTPEDITYMRGSMKQNLVVLLADLFNLFEIHPAKCVCYPGMDTQVTRSPSAIALRRNTPPKDNHALDHHHHYQQQQQQHNVTPMDEGFIVHKSRGVTTLSSMQEPLVPARLRQAKEKNNIETKADERGDSIPAGRPSNWEDHRRPSYAGRRSRRNSSSEDSQLTIENFGGSQEQLNMIGRTYDRDRERERKISSTSIEPAIAIRSSAADARGTLQIGYDTDSGSEKQDRETEKTIRRQASMDNVALRNITHSREKDLTDGDGTPKILSPRLSGFNNNNNNNNNGNYETEDVPKRKTSFATLPNTTTWQQQSILLNQSDHNDAYNADETKPSVDASKLSTIRMKLEEKRRHIEQEKRKMEIALSRHQEKVGKAAFLQAINKVDDGEFDSKWDTRSTGSKHSPDIESGDLERYQQQSIAVMNSNLQDIQQDIHRLATQQNQIQAQHLQAQQLMQAQQIANMLNQQQHFGSTPHLPQSYGSPSTYNSRPPSRDPYQQQQQQQQQQPHPIQYVNEHGQYISHQPLSGYPNSQFLPQQQQQFPMYAGTMGRDSQIYPENGNYPHYGGGGHPQYAPLEQNQYQSNQFINNRPMEYDDFHGGLNNRDQQFYLHDASQQPQQQRRTWAQSAAEQQYPQNPIQLDINAWQSQNASPPTHHQPLQQKIDSRTWKSPNVSSTLHGNNSGSGFMLHQNGGGDYSQHEKSYQNLFSIHSSPQHSRTPSRQVSTTIQRDNRTTVPAPPPEEMAPQSISFIGDDDDSVDQIEMNIETISPIKHSYPSATAYEIDGNLGKLNISSGSRTYRIPSPSRPLLNANSFQDPQHDASKEKGFYISFDNDQPRKPKPPLRGKKSPKKESSLETDSKQEQINQLKKELDHAGNQNIRRSSNNSIENEMKTNTYRLDASTPKSKEKDKENILRNDKHQQEISNKSSIDNHSNKESKALVIGTELSKLDPNSVDEMERKKEKIMLLSLQRRQQQEEAKARNELEAMKRREKEREKDEERARKKEEQAARRAAILEAHRLKKAIEEAEREGKVLDKTELMLKHQLSNLGGGGVGTTPQSAAKLRPQKLTRPRPKTIHVETGSVDLSEASSLSSRGKKGSSSNLTGYSQLSSNSIRRDYYRGSQDSLAIRESPDEYPSTSSTPIGRRGSYKNSRDTDSGLGRATPPRRAPSPGMGPSGRHLPSPSGPGSLPPGLMSKRRVFDDGSSDISSTPSSMMEYSGPKLYKQPAAKSNRGIILNAVEYCVFPGAVNRDAKQKVLEKIARAETKHFLILFRDAGCQFRALYSYWPENESIVKLYGTGPSQVDEVMFDKFFKYNSGGKCFSQVHTKHLTVTIDAFTIHNSLWQGKKVHLPSKKDMALVI